MNKKYLILLIVFLLVSGCKSKKNNSIPIIEKNNNDNSVTIMEKYNIHNDVISDKSIEGIDITDISVTIKNNVTQVFASVNNTTGNEYYLKGITILAKDENGEILASIPSYIGTKILPGETKYLNSSIDVDLSEAYSFDYEIEK